VIHCYVSLQHMQFMQIGSFCSAWSGRDILTFEVVTDSGSTDREFNCRAGASSFANSSELMFAAFTAASRPMQSMPCTLVARGLSANVPRAFCASASAPAASRCQFVCERTNISSASPLILFLTLFRSASSVRFSVNRRRRLIIPSNP